jgi:hypothetical protein
MGWMGIMLFAAIGETRLQHTFAETALFEEFFLQPQELPVYKVIRLMNRADGYVRDGFGWAGLYELTIKFVSLRDFAPEPPDIKRFF